jgi:uncharacterized DUF497 family protein
MSLKFEWDPSKAVSNLSKHGVSFQEALTAFADPLARIFDDEDHSIKEQREIIIGHSAKERLLVVCFTAQGDSVRSLVHERQRDEREKNMKKTSSRRRPKGEEMRREYRFDYRKSRPNRFATLMKQGTIAVVLDPDVASVFQSPESVNSLLRSVITALPRQTKAQLKSG